MATTTERIFQDWTRVHDGHPIAARQGVIVWDPTIGEYKVLWDDNGWEDFSPNEAKKGLKVL